MKSRTQSILLLLGPFIFGSFLEVQGCNSNMTFTVELIECTGADVLNDPVGVAKKFKDFICVSPCTEIEQSIQVSKIAFDLAIIDIQLVFKQTGEHVGAILVEHLTNTNPILASALVILINSFLQAGFKLEYFLCDTPHFVDPALDKAVIEIHNSVSDAQKTIKQLEECACKNNVYIKEDIPTQYEICVRKSINAFTVDFNTYLGHLAKFKYYYPDLTLEFANCLIKCEPNSDLKTALNTSDCLGRGEDKRFKQFYEIINELIVETVDVICKLENAIINIHKCGLFYVDKLYEMISNENVMCSLVDSECD